MGNDLEIVYDVVGGVRDYYHYHYNKYNIANNVEVPVIYIEKIKYIKEKLQRLNDSTIDLENMIITLKMNFQDLDSVYSMSTSQIIVTVPRKNIELDTIVKYADFSSQDNIEVIVEDIIYDIKKELSLIFKTNINDKFKYLIIDESLINVVLSYIYQYLVEFDCEIKTDNKLIISILDDSFNSEKVELLNQIRKRDITKMFKCVESIISKRILSDEELTNSLVIEKIYNYNTLIDFKYGEINISALVKDFKNNIYKTQYVISIKDLMEKFLSNKNYKNSIILNIYEVS